MTMVKTCAVCGAEYQARNSRCLTCSVACSRQQAK
jgi:hypothetical protein